MHLSLVCFSSEKPSFIEAGAELGTVDVGQFSARLCARVFKLLTMIVRDWFIDF